jgi:hypothetical protein
MVFVVISPFAFLILLTLIHLELIFVCGERYRSHSSVSQHHRGRVSSFLPALFKASFLIVLLNSSTMVSPVASLTPVRMDWSNDVCG